MDQVWDDLIEVIHNNHLHVKISQIISGGSKGVDQIGETYAMTYNYPLIRFPAQWDLLGRKAGPIRNQKMADYGDALVAIWDGESRGTMDMVKKMQEANKPVYLRRIMVMHKNKPNEVEDVLL